MASSPESVSAGGVNEVKLKYIEILKQNGITEAVSEVLVNDAKQQADGFISQQQYVTVKFENREVPQLNLFAKVYTSNPAHVEMVMELKAFEKEARFFTQYFSEAKQICERKGHLELMDIYPKCYYCDDKLTVLENLVLDKGYAVHPTEKKQGLEEAKAALLSLAKHHGISYAMIKKHGGGEGFIRAFKDFDFDPFAHPVFTMMMGPMIGNAFNNNMKLLEKHNVEGRDVTLERLKSIGVNPMEQIGKSFEIDPKDIFFVLNHGDYHNNNMMFKTDPAQKVLHHKAIDMQFVRYNSPGVDLGQYLFSSVSQEVRRKHLEELLTFYFTSLKKVVKDLGHAFGYSYEDVYLQFRKKFYQGFWLAFSLAGPGQSLMKDVNINEITDMSEIIVLIENAIQKWIEENPKQCEDVVKEIVGLVEEYYELRLD